MPQGATCAQSSREGLIDFSICEGFGLAIVPPETSKRGQIARQALFHIDAETIFTRDAPGVMSDVGRQNEALFELRDRLAIDPHVGVIGVRQQPENAGFPRNKSSA